MRFFHSGTLVSTWMVLWLLWGRRSENERTQSRWEPFLTSSPKCVRIQKHFKLVHSLKLVLVDSTDRQKWDWRRESKNINLPYHNLTGSRTTLTLTRLQHNSYVNPNRITLNEHTKRQWGNVNSIRIERDTFYRRELWGRLTTQ